MLVDIEYFFLYESFGFEFFHTCHQYKDILMPKFSWKMFFFNPWESVKVGNSEIFSTATHVGKFQISFFT